MFNRSGRNGWFYLMISAEIWLFWDQLSFDPPNCFEKPNKPLETTFHMPMHIPGPKDNQIWAFWGIFSTWNDNYPQGHSFQVFRMAEFALKVLNRVKVTVYSDLYKWLVTSCGSLMCVIEVWTHLGLDLKPLNGMKTKNSIKSIFPPHWPCG